MVTETVTRIPASDLTVIRVKCSKCDRVTEGDMTSIAKAFKDGKCPLCDEKLFDVVGGHPDNAAFTRLLRAFDDLHQMKFCNVEFVVTSPAK